MVKKKKNNDIMLDLETLGTRHDSVITQIGACYFDRHTAKIGKTLLVNVEINSSLERGMTVTGGAIKFWVERGENATFLEKPERITLALAKVSDFMKKKKKAIIWCHSTFDAIILANAYYAIGQGLPYSYRAIRDIRTLVDLSGVKREKSAGDPKTHDALEDCIYQVGYCCECFKGLEEKK